MRWVLATGNPGKVREFNLLFADTPATFISQKDAGFREVVEETGRTFEANAELKARAVFGSTGLPALADDSGLQVKALNGAPGVYSARYAGPEATDAANNQKLLENMKGVEERSARFVCVLCYIAPGEEPVFFRGECRGRIGHRESGRGGFGYDPLFYPDGFKASFGSLDPRVKLEISHRARAVQSLKAGLFPGADS